MTAFFDFDEIVGDINEILKQIQNLNGKWDIKHINEPNLKGYVIQGRFWSDQPFDPFKPFNPLERRPMPKRPFSTPNNINEIREPFVDVFEEDTLVKIYIELPGENKDNIQLNITEDKVEVKAEKFYKMINVPGIIEVEKASSKYNNGVLTVIIPKKEKSSRNNQHKIQIE